MAKSVYLISEAAKEVCVENHVLRYWEEELALPVKRNSQGHRYYTMEDLNTFKRIKYLKEQGLQLKAIKLFLSRDNRREKAAFIHQGDKVTAFCRETSQRSMAEQDSSGAETMEQEKNTEVVLDKEQISQENRNEKAQKLQMILRLMIEEVLREYDSDLKEELKEGISEKLCADVKDAVIKEMDYQFRMQEEREEKRGQEREDKDQELLQRIEEILKAKKIEKADKTEKIGKTEKTRQKKLGFFSWKSKNALS
ncbi:MAG: helix-turn-helix domain-containing protein [Lachnospiraceae bacterium]|nr:helix-turn-helix domain-containing protein [Lachnospiraceae bacterium]